MCVCLRGRVLCGRGASHKASADAAVFFEQQLITVGAALAAVADRAAARNVPVALAGHDVGIDDVIMDDVVIEDDGVDGHGGDCGGSESSGDSNSGSAGSSSSSSRRCHIGSVAGLAGVGFFGRLVVRPTNVVLYPRYFVPDPPEEVELTGDNGDDEGQGSAVVVPVVGAANLGMWCNDRAFDAGANLGDEAACKTGRAWEQMRGF